MPENSSPCKTLCCGCPYETKKSINLVLPPSQSTLKYGSENRPWVRGLKILNADVAPPRDLDGRGKYIIYR